MPGFLVPLASQNLRGFQGKLHRLILEAANVGKWDLRGSDVE